MIDISRLGRKKTIKNTQGRVRGRRGKKLREWHLLEENGEG